jgi:hypothetical protein
MIMYLKSVAFNLETAAPLLLHALNFFALQPLISLRNRLQVRACKAPY